MARHLSPVLSPRAERAERRSLAAGPDVPSASEWLARHRAPGAPRTDRSVVVAAGWAIDRGRDRDTRAIAPRSRVAAG